MKTTGLANKIVTDAGLTNAYAKKNVDGIFAAIGGDAAAAHEVSLPGFGNFQSQGRSGT